MITRQQKEEKVQEIKQDMQESGFLVLTDYRGLNVKDISELRRTLKQEGCKYKVVKNNLAKIAAKETGLDDINDYLEGPVAIAYTSEDPIALAKALTKADKDYKSLSLKVAYLDGKILEPSDIKDLGEIPSKEVLQARLCGALQGPISGFANVLQANLRNLVYALEAIREQKEAG